MNIIKFDKVSIGYIKNQKILKDFSLEIKKGDFVSIIGPNASGKSTIIKSLIKLIKPIEGTIQYEGKNIFDYKPKNYSKLVAYVPQISDFPDDITVYNFVSMGRYPHNSFFYSDEKENKRIVDWAIEKVDLKGLSDQYLSELSGGQKQRALIALALAQDTETILLDEPTNHLDIKYQLEIIHLLHDLNHTHNKTIILVIHDINHGIKFA
ncbi:MAG: ABC transporter ATP-binding protein, partial [Malacoplasma sp.]